MLDMNFWGLLVGLVSFLCIGVFHPIVVWVEYNYGRGVWKYFFVAGLLVAILSLFFSSTVVSMLVGTIGFSLLWTSHEVIAQHERVLKGQARRNPNREYRSLLPIMVLGLRGLNYVGLVVGASTFLIMAIGRLSVIKAEYYFTKKAWIAYMVLGLCAIVTSLLIYNIVLSAIVSVMAFVLLWGIGEVIKQEERVKKGWFPTNPNRRKG